MRKSTFIFWSTSSLMEKKLKSYFEVNLDVQFHILILFWCIPTLYRLHNLSMKVSEDAIYKLIWALIISKLFYNLLFNTIIKMKSKFPTALHIITIVSILFKLTYYSSSRMLLLTKNIISSIKLDCITDNWNIGNHNIMKKNFSTLFRLIQTT